MGIFRKKVEFEDERTPLPEVWKLVIVFIVIIGMYIAANKVTDYIYEQDIRMYNEAEYVRYNDENV